MASFRARPMVAVVSASIPVFTLIVSGTWYLSARLTKQDRWMRIVDKRLGRIEKYMGLGMWDDSDG
jgi:hypothetical protein